MTVRTTWAAIFLALLLAACGDPEGLRAPAQEDPVPEEGRPIVVDVTKTEEPTPSAPDAPAARPQAEPPGRLKGRALAEHWLARYDAEPEAPAPLKELARHGLPVSRKLMARMADAEDAQTRERAFVALRAIFRKTAERHRSKLSTYFTLLTMLIEEGNAEVARLSWVLLAELPPDVVRSTSGPLLLQGFTHDQVSVRRFAIAAMTTLGAYAPKETEERLDLMSKADPEFDVRGDARAALKTLRRAREGDIFVPPENWCPGPQPSFSPPPFDRNRSLEELLALIEELERKLEEQEKDKKGK